MEEDGGYISSGSGGECNTSISVQSQSPAQSPAKRPASAKPPSARKRQASKGGKEGKPQPSILSFFGKGGAAPSPAKKPPVARSLTVSATARTHANDEIKSEEGARHHAQRLTGLSGKGEAIAAIDDTEDDEDDAQEGGGGGGGGGGGEEGGGSVNGGGGSSSVERGGGGVGGGDASVKEIEEVMIDSKDSTDVPNCAFRPSGGGGGGGGGGKGGMAEHEAASVPERLYSEDYDPVKDSCWKEGGPAPFLHLARCFNLIEKERGRLKMGTALRNMFLSIISLSPEDLLPALYLTAGKLAPTHENIELKVGGSAISSVIREVTGVSRQGLSSLYQKLGDPGDVAQECRSNQRLLVAPSALTVRGVYSSFRLIASEEKQGSAERRKSSMAKLLRSCREEEARYLIRALCRNMRIGANTTTILGALAHAVVHHERSQKKVDDGGLSSGGEVGDGGGSRPTGGVNVRKKGVGKSGAVEGDDKDELKAAASTLCEAYAMCPSFDVLVPALIQGGISGVASSCVLTPGTPVKPMLAKVSTGVDDLFAQMGKRFGAGGNLLAEHKYDGQRALIHLLPGNGGVRIFSRHGHETTPSLPDVVDMTLRIAELGGVDSGIFDAEVVAVEVERERGCAGGLLPFQSLATRGRGNVAAEDVKVTVCVFVFDLLFLNGRPLVKLPLSERRRELVELVEGGGGGRVKNFEMALSAEVDTSKGEEAKEEMQNLLRDALKGQAEGLMVKHLDATGGYEPGKRSDMWLKVKKDYVEGLADTLDLVPIGAWWGNGRKAGWFSPWLMAAIDTDTGELQSLCRVMSGFTDAFYKEATERFLKKTCESQRAHIITNEQPSVWFETDEVWEVKGADLTISPVHMCGCNIMDGKGLALRFPRFLRIRDDKSVEDATSAGQMVDMFRKQANRGGGDAGGAVNAGSESDDWD